ncbi:MAG TPA: chemotaxis protein CheW [Gemmatimonadales bacterium]|jgi:chemotaxis signal transduction protein|nr:chemotaxis protein CheW [Gemmatimonadales bacterium]
MSERTGFLLVRAGGRLVGLPLEHLVAVAAIGEVHPVPSPELAMRGVARLRSETMPVLHLGALLAGTRCPAEAGDTGVVVEADGFRLCLEVDEADVVSRATVMPLPADTSLPWARGVARTADGLVPLLDLPALGARLAGKETDS